MTRIAIPEFALVVLIGVSGSGKSTFAQRHFLQTEVISSDFCRGLVADDENDQSASRAAFDVLHVIVSKRLERKKLTVVDATNVQPEARKRLLEIAREFHALPVALVLDVPERVAIERNARRPDRAFGAQVITRQRQNLKRSLRGLEREGFRRVTVMRSVDEVEQATITREPLWTDRRSEHGPFDIIGDVHGCFDELVLVLENLGYRVDTERLQAIPPTGRKAVFLGDLVDRGPKVVPTLKLAMKMVSDGHALCVPGNHDIKLLRKLKGKNVQITHGLAESLEQLETETPEFRTAAADFIESLTSHFVLDDGKLVVAHAGMKEDMAGRASGAVRAFALYGETTGETDEFGLPVRYNWASDYRGSAMVVYGHTPVPAPQWLNRTINIDTGCVFGGALTALQYPEGNLISVPALRQYAEPVRPFAVESVEPADRTVQQEQDDVLDIGDVLVLDGGMGKRFIETRLENRIQIRAENASAALEVMSRFAIDPKWLIYLPPTMSPVETSNQPDVLEYPTEAFAYYRKHGVETVMCEEKHMGSRAVVILCRDESAARSRFGVDGDSWSAVYTRTGRRFFNDAALEAGLLERLRAAVTAAELWETLDTDWVAFDCELMPWSAKALELLQSQYAAVASAGTTAIEAAVTVLRQASTHYTDAQHLLSRYEERAQMVERFRDAYRRYSWDVSTTDDLRLAPFHILASAGRVHADKPHTWHMDMIERMRRNGDSILHPTATQIVNLSDTAAIETAVRWWEALTDGGGEGMVVKPLDFIARGKRGLLQPALKVRGREYLRIIYGPEYTRPDQLERLRARHLGAKRALALREFALGIEALERFVRGEPLRRIHECVFGVLALESEPIDPRL